MNLLKKSSRQPFFQNCPIQKGCICDPNLQIENKFSAINVVKEQFMKHWSSFLSQIFCICLEERPDRLTEASQQFHKYGLCKLVQFYRTFRPSPEEIKMYGIQCRGFYGIWNSHQDLAKISEKQRYENILVFEDDILFIENRMTPDLILSLGTKLSNLPKNWEIFYLGHIPFFALPSSLDLSVWKVHSMMAHSYILSWNGINKLSSCDYITDVRQNNGSERGIDQWFCANFNQYALWPQIAVQSGSNSSNYHLKSSFFQDIVVPWGIETHRDNSDYFEIFTYFLLPVLLIVIFMWSIRKQKRLIILCIFLLFLQVWRFL